MELTTYLPPRRWVLWFILLLGLFLRLWGITWAAHQGEINLHPGEWSWQVIDALSWQTPSFAGIWTQTFFSLAAIVKGLAQTVGGWVGVWLGELSSPQELHLSARLVGRYTVALLGAAQVGLVYILGRRVLDSVAAGLLAAALVAVSPLMVAHSHFLSLDVPAGTAALCLLLALVYLIPAPNWRGFFLCGLGLGLAVTTRSSTGLLAVPLVLAYLLLIYRHRPGPLTALAAWPAALAGGLALGLMLGYPGFVLNTAKAQQVVAGSVVLPPLAQGAWLAHLVSRGEQWLRLIGPAVGWEMVGLWLAGLALALSSRKMGPILVSAFGPLYLMASLLLLTGSLEGLQAVWWPSGMVFVAWPVVLLCRRMGAYRYQVAAASLLGILLCIWPLWRSLAVDYLFWEPESRVLARQWMEQNIPQGPRVLVGSGHLFQIKRPATVADWQDADTASGEEEGYAVVSDLDGPGPASSLPLENFQPLARFELKPAIPRLPGTPQSDFPAWVSPRVLVYSTLPRHKPRIPLALARPAVGGKRSYAVVVRGTQVYGCWDSLMSLDEPGRSRRVLFSMQPPRELGLHLTNLGRELARLTVGQGPWRSGEVVMYPGQETRLGLKIMGWPPMMEGHYPVSLNLHQGSGVQARLEWNPLILGREALEEGNLERAVELLQRAVKESGGFDARSLLAGALALAGRFNEAKSVLAGMEDPWDDPVSGYAALAQAGRMDSDWDRRFLTLTGYHPQLLRRAISRTYQVAGPTCQAGAGEVTLTGQGFHGSFRRRTGAENGQLNLWLQDPHPRGPWRMDLKLRLHQPAPTNQELARVELWSHGPAGDRRLAQKMVRGGDLPGGRGVIPLTLYSQAAWCRPEIRLIFTGDREVLVDWIRLGTDLTGHMRRMLRWFHEASGRVALAEGLAAKAVTHFEQVLALDPYREPIYLPLAKALVETARLDAAARIMAQAETLYQSQPAELAVLLDLYRTLGRSDDVKRLEQRLAHLHPSLARPIGFAGGMNLLGYDLPESEVSPGGRLAVSYYWKADRPQSCDYFIFAHLRGPGGTVNFDHRLDHGRRDMTTLSPGEVVREDYHLVIPSDLQPGTYRLMMGLWDSQFTKERVPIVQGDAAAGNEFLLSEIVIK